MAVPSVNKNAEFLIAEPELLSNLVTHLSSVSSPATFSERFDVLGYSKWLPSTVQLLHSLNLKVVAKKSMFSKVT